METSDLNELKQLVAEIMDIVHANGLLEWDQQTYMPPLGSQARAEQIATLSKIAHQKFTSPQMGSLLERLESQFKGGDPEDDDFALFRQLRRQYERQTKLPTDLVVRLSRTASLARDKWVEARKENNFSLFAPYLSEILELEREKADVLGYEESIYDALIEDFEPGMKASEVKQMFNKIKDGLLPLLEAIKESPAKIRRDFLFKEYPIDKQWQVSIEILEKMGFDFKRGREDKSAHPFTTSFSVNDVRLTNRFQPNLFTSSIFSALHEGGHALYDQGINPLFDRSILKTGSSFGVHESQSRLWENIVGRSLPFWYFYFPRLKEIFPEQLAGVDVEDFYAAINYVEPSPIRVEADEVTYNLHTLLRFELELDLLEGRVKVEELPELWDSKMVEYIGYRPKNNAEGVLQDVHWSEGYFGYFPSYTVGNILSVQFYLSAQKEIPDLEESFQSGKFSPFLEWLREKIHRHGAKFYPGELVKRVTGSTMDPQPLLDYLRDKYSQIYHLN